MQSKRLCVYAGLAKQSAAELAVTPGLYPHGLQLESFDCAKTTGIGAQQIRLSRPKVIASLQRSCQLTWRAQAAGFSPERHQRALIMGLLAGLKAYCRLASWQAKHAV